MISVFDNDEAIECVRNTPAAATMWVEQCTNLVQLTQANKYIQTTKCTLYTRSWLNEIVLFLFFFEIES